MSPSWRALLLATLDVSQHQPFTPICASPALHGTRLGPLEALRRPFAVKPLSCTLPGLAQRQAWAEDP